MSLKVGGGVLQQVSPVTSLKSLGECHRPQTRTQHRSPDPSLKAWMNGTEPAGSLSRQSIVL